MLLLLFDDLLVVFLYKNLKLLLLRELFYDLLSSDLDSFYLKKLDASITC